MNEKKYHTLKKSIRMMKSKRSDLEEKKLIKDGKRMGIEEIVRQNEKKKKKNIKNIKKITKIIFSCIYINIYIYIYITYILYILYIYIML